MDKFLIARRTENPITGPIMVTTSPRATCPQSCAFKKGGDGPLAGLCYAEHGALGGYVWTLLDRTPVGRTVMNGTRVYGFDELLYIVRALEPGALWRHNIAGDLTSNNQSTIERAALRAIIDANKGRRGFTFTHYDVLTNLANRQVIEEANSNGFTINLSGNSLAHADALADLRIAPVTVILPAGTKRNTTTPKGRTVDRSGQGNHGGFFGRATSTAKTIGKLGQALQFDGVNDRVITGEVTIPATFSAAMWMYIGADPAGTFFPFFNDML